jgi:hypothetical protein
MNEENAMTALSPRDKPDVKSMVEEIRRAAERAGNLDFYARMEANHWTRHNYWEGQSWSGRKELLEGTDPRKVFPWPGASDARVPLIDELINERTDQLIVAFDLARFRVGPRDLTVDNNAQNRAVLWSGVAEYYQDETREMCRTAMTQWADWSEEFGHALLYVGWDEELALERKALTERDLLQMQVQAALTAATNEAVAAMQASGTPVEDPSAALTEQQQQAIAVGVEARLAEVVRHPAEVEALMAALMEYDGAMPESEARRIAGDVRRTGAAEYFVPYVHKSQPCWTACMPYIDALYPPEVRHIQKAPWVALAEWLTEAELRERVASEGWSESWVERLLKHKGRAFDFGAQQWASQRDWVLAGGMVGTGVNAGSSNDAPLYQVLHVFYRATAQAGVPCVYRTVLSGWIDDESAIHEPCPYAHGQYPFRERVREAKAKTMIESRGIGEISFSDQSSLKTHRDQRNDNASLQLLPPAEVTVQQAGGRFPLLRPGVQIPRRSTGASGINWLKPPGDPAASERAEQDIRLSSDRYWGRGAAVDPDVKLTRARARVNHFLTDVREVWKLTFQLIQQYAPDELRVASVRGLPVDLQATREDIQGQVSLDLTFDPADFDVATVLKKLQVLNEGLLPLDRSGSINTNNILRAAVSAIMPGWVSEIIPQSSEQTKASEIEDEDRALGQLLLGMEQPYVPGRDHQARLETLRRRMTAQNPDGSPCAAARIAQANPDIAALIENRMKFHQFQLEQQQNADIGRKGVDELQSAQAA